MIVTDKYVMINYPRTGSTFVRSVLGQLHRSSPFDRLACMLGLKENPYYEVRMAQGFETYYREGEQKLCEHGNVASIPAEHRSKSIVSVMRNPFERYVSLYEFGAWARRPPADSLILRKAFPRFPALSFAEFVRYLNTLLLSLTMPGVSFKADLGIQTVTFIHFFANDPLKTLRSMDRRHIESPDFASDIAPVTFLRTETLNQDLYEFLLSMGYEENRVAFILSESRRNTSSRRYASWESYYDAETLEYVRYRERFVFRLFPEYLDVGS